MILAQAAETVQRANQGLLKIFDYIGSLDFPTRAELIADLEATGDLQAVILALAGVPFLILGFKCFKALVVINAAGIGGLCGMYVGVLSKSQNMPLLLGLAGAVLLGTLAWKTIKYCVCVMGALAGGLLGYGLWHFVASALGRPGLTGHSWAGGLVGMVAVGMLAFIIFRTAVMIFTAVQGSLMIVAGALAVLLPNDSIRNSLVNNDYVLNILVGVPAAVGFVYQHSEEAGKIRKKRKETEKPPV